MNRIEIVNIIELPVLIRYSDRAALLLFLLLDFFA